MGHSARESPSACATDAVTTAHLAHLVSEHHFPTCRRRQRAGPGGHPSARPPHGPGKAGGRGPEAPRPFCAPVSSSVTQGTSSPGWFTSEVYVTGRRRGFGEAIPTQRLRPPARAIGLLRLPASRPLARGRRPARGRRALRLLGENEAGAPHAPDGRGHWMLRDELTRERLHASPGLS